MLICYSVVIIFLILSLISVYYNIKLKKENNKILIMVEEYHKKNHSIKNDIYAACSLVSITWGKKKDKTKQEETVLKTIAELGTIKE